MMVQCKLMLGWLSLAMVIGLGNINLRVYAQSSELFLASKYLEAELVEISFLPPPGEGAPKHTASGASRGSCPRPEALLPDENAYGLTTQTNPSILVYLPQSSAQQIFLTLKSDSGDYYYDSMMEIATQSGTVSVTLPDDAPPLILGEVYQWSVVLMCDGEIRPDSPFTQGWIRLVELDETMRSDLVDLSSMEQAALYGQQGIWYDMLSILAHQRVIDPDNHAVERAWNNVLKAENLERFVDTLLISLD